MFSLRRSLSVFVLVAAGAFAGRQAQKSWTSVIAYAPPYQIADGAPGAGAPVAESVVLVLVDGLRLDASREMPVLNRLRAEGADLDCTAAAPSYSRPGRATLATGAWSEIHGATSNYHDKAIAVDNVFREAARAGRSTLVVGSLWSSLFGPDLERATLRKPPLKDERGRYFQQEPGLRAWGLESAAFVGSTPANLAVLDLLVTDYAAHEFGARSEEYRRAVLRSDGMIEELVKRLDLTRTAIVVTSDHGHLDEGGHGGPEPEVLATPLVLAGKGIRHGVRSAARQIDVAPTVAALLGLAPPAASQGRVLADVLDLGDDQRLAMLARQWRQKAGFARAYLTSLGAAAGAPADPTRAIRLPSSPRPGPSRTGSKPAARRERPRSGRPACRSSWLLWSCRCCSSWRSPGASPPRAGRPWRPRSSRTSSRSRSWSRASASAWR